MQWLSGGHVNTKPKSACVIGAGPNGLAAAIVLAQAGLSVDVYEAQPQAGGGARTLELTLPGFLHDFGSAVHPLAVGSPFFSSLPLQDHGLEWIQPSAPVAHPLDDGTAVMLERDLRDAGTALGEDGVAWCKLMEPLVNHWSELAREALRPVRLLPEHPILMARFGLAALRSAQSLSNGAFRNPRTKALFAGIAAHSVLSLDEPFSAAAGVLLGAAAHAVGWPIPRGGAQSITKALCAHLAQFGVSIRTSEPVANARPHCRNTISRCVTSPRANSCASPETACLIDSAGA